MHKIAIEGESGTGKTTLAKAIAIDLSIEYFPENLKDLYENLFIYKKAVIDHESEENILLLQKQFLEKINACMNDRVKKQNQLQGYVLDRSVIKLFALLLNNAIGIKNNQFIERMLGLLQREADALHLTVVLPLSEYSFLPSHNEDGLNRVIALGSKLRYQSLVAGLCLTAVRTPILFVPSYCKTVDERVSLIKEKLDYPSSNGM
jgi:DNA polymerase III delta prime subunit